MSDHDRMEGSVTLYEAKEWMGAWSQILDLDLLNLAGGEPMLNPDLADIAREARRLWPTTPIQITTNGEHLLDSNIIFLLKEIGNATLLVSCHWNLGPKFDALQQAVVNELNQHGNWNIVSGSSPEIHLQAEQGDVTVQMAAYPEFIKTYHGHGITMRPYHSKSYQASYSVCGTPKSPILYKNRLYKCGASANMRDVLEIHNLADNAEWYDYLKYKGYGPEDNIQEFIDDYGQANALICRMCSPVKQHALVEHYDIAMVTLRK
jgi:hypothetical protein